MAFKVYHELSVAEELKDTMKEADDILTPEDFLKEALKVVHERYNVIYMNTEIQFGSNCRSNSW